MICQLFVLISVSSRLPDFSIESIVSTNYVERYFLTTLIDESIHLDLKAKRLLRLGSSEFKVIVKANK